MSILKFLAVHQIQRDCDSITMGDSADCDNLPAGGTVAKAIVINKKDVDEVTIDENGYVTDITLLPGKFAYLYEGLGNAFKKSEDFAKSAVTGLGNYKHKNSMIIYKRTQEMKEQIKKFGNGRFLFALFNNGEDNDAIEIGGLDVGVQMVAGEIRNSYANEGFFVLNFATPEGDTENEKAPMRSVGPTYADGLAMLEALLPAS